MNTAQRSLVVLYSYFLLVACFLILAYSYRKHKIDISRIIALRLRLRVLGLIEPQIRQEVNRLALAPHERQEPPPEAALPPDAAGLRHRHPHNGDAGQQQQQQVVPAAPESHASSESPVEPENPEEMDRRFICVVCLDRPRTTLLKPCNHLCLCESCADTLRMPPPLVRNPHPRCPVCQQIVYGRLRVYIA